MHLRSVLVQLLMFVFRMFSIHVLECISMIMDMYTYVSFV